MVARIKEGVNVNTIMLAVLLGLSTWTLRSVQELREQNVLLQYRVQQLEHKMQISKVHPRQEASAMSPVLGLLGSSSPSK